MIDPCRPPVPLGRVIRRTIRRGVRHARHIAAHHGGAWVVGLGCGAAPAAIAALGRLLGTPGDGLNHPGGGLAPLPDGFPGDVSGGFFAGLPSDVPPIILPFDVDHAAIVAAVSVAEPASVWLLAIGVVLLLAVRRWKAR